jgi:hypothetical protein
MQLNSPVAAYTGKAIAPKVGISPILRAGIGMTERASPSPSPILRQLERVKDRRSWKGN